MKVCKKIARFQLFVRTVKRSIALCLYLCEEVPLKFVKNLFGLSTCKSKFTLLPLSESIVRESGAQGNRKWAYQANFLFIINWHEFPVAVSFLWSAAALSEWKAKKFGGKLAFKRYFHFIFWIHFSSKSTIYKSSETSSVLEEFALWNINTH